jgi:hypothetical protein
MDSFIQEFGIDTRELRVRECSKYHIQFWRGDRCLLNVWPSQRRFQVAECDGPSEVGTPEEAAVALERAFNRKNQKEPRSIEQEVGEAVGCLGGYLTTYDVQALYDAKKIIESLVHQLRHTNRQRDSDDREDRVTQIFNDQ